VRKAVETSERLTNITPANDIRMNGQIPIEFSPRPEKSRMLEDLDAGPPIDKRMYGIQHGCDFRCQSGRLSAYEMPSGCPI
jgi:hypothetical protein